MQAMDDALAALVEKGQAFSGEDALAKAEEKSRFERFAKD
jgi:hypothetical protein